MLYPTELRGLLSCPGGAGRGGPCIGCSSGRGQTHCGDGRALHRQLSRPSKRLARRAILADVGRASLVGRIPEINIASTAATTTTRQTNLGALPSPLPLG
jgi:hypothetical protein